MKGNYTLDSGQLSQHSDGLQAGSARFDSWQHNIFLLCSVQTDSGSHPAFYPVGTVDYFLGRKAAGAYS
jgi:hypothetical protein